ncbi:helix-turn-helix domain-containing protein [Kribbella sp. CA-247076]|uniref:helix-turn-helix domain-containing protein n=1 Tax=Kribbella sp. CA-247076 TaxID=3239941 RepID=UPI003D9218B9
MAEAAFGARLRQCRQAVGLSLRQLAARVGYDHSYLSQVERGQRPGSAELARLCDRELGTGTELSDAFARRRSTPPAPDPLAVAWQKVAAAFGCTGVSRAFGEAARVPPGRLLPALVAELQVMQSDSAVEAAQLSALTAQTLTALGQAPAAGRWWLAARGAASSAGGAVHSQVLAQEVLSGLAERRPLPQLLESAEQAAGDEAVAQAHAARALVLAELGRHGEAHRALQELIGVADGLPTARAYEVHAVEGRVCARLGYGAAGCVLLARALELCPEEWVGEQARLRMALAECLAVDGEIAAGVALALRVLVELPDEWHTYYLYDDGARVLSAVQDRRPGAAATLQELLRRTPYLDSRSVGSGSSAAR